MAEDKVDMLLASRSPRRLAVLAQIAVVPKGVVPPTIDEKPRNRELPKDFALRMAGEKAAAVARQHQSDNILSADTVVAMGRRILQTPPDATAARQMIKNLQGRRSRIITAMVLLTRDGKRRERVSINLIKLKQLNSQEIDDYIARGEWAGRAGGLALDGSAAAWLVWLGGSPTACLGLDAKLTHQLLRGAGLIGVQK